MRPTKRYIVALATLGTFLWIDPWSFFEQLNSPHLLQGGVEERKVIFNDDDSPSANLSANDNYSSPSLFQEITAMTRQGKTNLQLVASFTENATSPLPIIKKNESVLVGKVMSTDDKENNKHDNDSPIITQRIPAPSAPPYIFTCTSHCVQGSFWPHKIGKRPACIGTYESNGLRKKPWSEQGNVAANNDETIWIDGDVFAVFSGIRNINHALHDEIWSALLWLSHKPYYNVTVMVQSNQPWTSAVLRLCSRVYNWKVYQAPLASGTFCATQNMYLNGYIHVIRKYEGNRIVQLRNDLRKEAISSLQTTSDEREKVIIYTRQDSPWRHLNQVNFVLDLFDHDRFNVTVLPKIPTYFDQQVEIFSQAALFLAPNGAWAPNTLWMDDRACLVELHLYKTDSWIDRYGLKQLFRGDNFITVTGDYKDPNKPRIERPNRQGGDDEILGSLVADDIRQGMLKSPSCKRFLKVDPDPPGSSAEENKTDANPLHMVAKNSTQGKAADDKPRATCNFFEESNANPKFTNITFINKLRHDRAGSVILDLFMALAYCHQNGLHYGGVCVADSSRQKESQYLLNKLGISHLFHYYQDCFASNSTHVLLDKDLHGYRSERFMFNESFRQCLMSHSSLPGKPSRQSQHPHVAVHMRRGDVTPCHNSENIRRRYLPNQHYSSILHRYAPKATDVTIYSESKSYESLENFTRFDIVLGGDTWRAWQDFATADVVVLSKSSFSYVPAILNRGKVIYTGFWHKAFPGWTTVDSNILEASIARKREMVQEECGLAVEVPRF